ncbi:TMEM175 family protein [Streptomyces lancefieldiae]|uniref:TMEM175 family protein n=1 Tax=Streptomyces lancefieldiae TaxID=3075520 RepID=A0ABU3ANG0_9ACTN|nr:TMEM175 family protein [Streptomyces sp. DSM 40712]MDT0611102.1 TMEM175 family protein [Streptomyces sp. DSM 40712]
MGDSPLQGSERDGFAQTDTSRVEAFSDAVMAIAITILALEMRTPEHASGHLLSGLLHQWPVYLGYLISFAYIGVIWLNHHQAFTRIRTVDRGLHAANLALLLTTAALAFPTAVISEALQEDLVGSDARTAVALYALIAAAMCASWLWIYVHLAGKPALLSPRAEPRYVRQGQARSAAGILAYAVGGALGWFLHPVIALAVFLCLPVFYFVTSEGLPQVRRQRS